MSAVHGFAVICTAPVFCPDTDGCMGEGSFVYERFGTKSEAQSCADRLNLDGEERSYHVELRPFREGEDKLWRPTYSLIELANDARASAENCPPWAL
jgi:hypothetical protein